MKLKIDEKGSAVLDNGNPVYIHPDGTEEAIDVKTVYVERATARRESGERRTALDAAKAELAKFSGIEDPAAALKAMALAASFEGKKVMDDEGFQKLLQANMKPILEENEALKAANGEKESQIYQMQVGGKFATSEFLKKTIWSETPEDAELKFAKNFKVDGKKVVGYDDNGNVIFNKTGEPANFEESIAHLINNHPKKDHYLRSTGGGSGAQQSQGGGSANAAALANMSPVERITAARAAGQKT